ncbi:MAG: radical SAM protein [Candidatus Marinimicrobia bacterium]|nr:radical SAM protein [bacterium]MCG2717202.1 radical SAM protein [Candidatus Neomarinimicrobiota bacterium]
MNEDNSYIDLMNQGISQLVKDALRVSLLKPSLALFILQTIRWQKRAEKRRLECETRGVHVPPFMIISITNRCNLQCKGCYSRAQQRINQEEMSTDKLGDVIAEAHSLGVSIILLAGGEPFIRKDIFDITSQFPDIIFPVFTNGMLLDVSMQKRLKKQKNVLPIISMEGQREHTNNRRGKGVYEYLENIITRIKDTNIFSGASFTMTRQTFDILTDESFIESVVKLGCKLFFFIDYIPVQKGTEDMELTLEQSRSVFSLMNRFRDKFPALFVAFPGDEEQFGGCLSSGRGFIHISPDGSLEPCPFAPYSDSSLKNLSLTEALQSKFLQTIRENRDKLDETNGGCALWVQREWVRSLLETE